MQTQTIERVWARCSASPATFAAYAGAAAFVIAAGWFWLATKNVTTYPPPRIGPHVPALEGMRIYYRWQATTLPQERYYTVIACLGFIGLAIAVRFIRDVADRGRALGTTGAALVGLGMLAVAAAATREHAGHHAWASYTIVIALTLLVLAWSYATSNSDLSDLLLFAVGVVPLPLWLIWTCRIGRIEHQSPNAD
jgi:hypothetical protein